MINSLKKWTENYYSLRVLKRFIKKFFLHQKVPEAYVFSFEDVSSVEVPPKTKVWECEHEEEAISLSQIEGSTQYVRIDSSRVRKFYYKVKGCEKKEFGLSFENYLQYISYLGKKDFYVTGLSAEERKEIHEATEKLYEKYGVRFRSFSKYRIGYRTYCTESGFISFPFDDIYIMSIRYIASAYRAIAVLSDSKLSERIYDDLLEAGKSAILVGNYSDIESSSIKDDIEIIVSTDLNDKGDVIHTIDGRSVFHLRFHDLFTIYSDEKPLDRDLAANIIPQWNRLGVKTILLKDPRSIDVPKRFRENFDNFEELFVNTEHRKNFLGDEIDFDGLKMLHTFNLKGKYIDYADCSESGANRTNGERLTIGSSYDSKPDIYFFGPCTMCGGYCSDASTIESYLQKLVGDNYHIHNMCTHASFSAMKMRMLKLKQGDCIVYMPFDTSVFDGVETSIISLEECYLTDTEERIHYWWDTNAHINWKMNKIIAEYLYKTMIPLLNSQNEGFSRCLSLLDARNIRFDYLYRKYNKTFNEWYDRLNTTADSTKKNGCIVMNGNPVTEGHRYLISEATKEVDQLYIFVLQEEKSFFSFKDRLTMVKLACDGIDNVTVLPSGNFIISNGTMPGYFDKENLQEEKLDASTDLSLFCEVIAPLFSISIRFVGDEPEDKFTKQYNDQMREILPEYGIELKIYDRKKSGDATISGTRVREYYRAREWDKMTGLVPEAVIGYMRGLSSV